MRVWISIIVGFLALPSLVEACSIPVFRYALERWAPSPYEVVIFRRGPLTGSQRQELKAIDDLARGANLDLTEVDLDGRGNKALLALWAKQGKDRPLPWVLVRFPDSDSTSALAWSGPLEAEKLRPLVMSPVRERIARKLIHGDSAIFLLLESGDETADAEAAKVLGSELSKFEKTFPLPVLTREGPQLRSELPLRISLPVMRLSRQNAEEQGLIDLLLNCEDGLDKAKGPIVFAIFGRGRVLTALHGKDLKASELEAVTRFLCGACSCQVKELNPGVDLVFKTRWEAILEIEIAPTPREPKSVPTQP